ncbi:MAG TPA: hypothetical protein VKV02_09865 [Acidobacteriaceae bacterium]|nr:hypothetical protein [Acidobacteriaceae bacterium]
MPLLAAALRVPTRALLACLFVCAAGCNAQTRNPAPITKRPANGTSISSVASAPSEGRAEGTGGPGKPTVPHTLMDTAWGLPYGTVTLPVGWGFNGGVVHGGDGCLVTGDGPMWSAESADKRFGIAVLPALKTNFSTAPFTARALQQGHCPILRSTSATDYLVQYVLPHLHGRDMRIVAREAEPELEPMAAQMRGMSAQLEAISNGNQFSRMHATVTTARVLVQYQEGGRTMNEMASAVFSCYDTVSNMPMMGRSETLDCTAPVTMIAHGPDDGTPFDSAHIAAHKNDPPFFTMTQNPAWTQRFNAKMELARQQQQQMGQQLAAQGQQNMQNLQNRFDANQAQYRAQQGMYAQHNQAEMARQDAVHNSNQAFAMHMGDSNIYTNPQTGQQVQLSNQYNNTYINQNGDTALQTNSATSPGVNWTLLQPKY